MSEDKKYYSIGEAGRLTGLEPYVLRFWESEFDELSPEKNKSGRRVYRQKDIDIVLLLKKLLHEKKFTIEGAKKVLRDNSSKPAGQAELGFKTGDMQAKMIQIRNELKDILALFD